MNDIISIQLVLTKIYISQWAKGSTKSNSWANICTPRPDKHDRVFLVPCASIYATVLAYTGKKSLLQGTRNTQPFKIGHPIFDVLLIIPVGVSFLRFTSLVDRRPWNRHQTNYLTMNGMGFIFLLHFFIHT